MSLFTYDVQSLIGKVRLFCLDTNAADYIFTDVELQVFLDQSQRSPMLAAAFALDIIAIDAAKVAVITKNDNQSTDPTKMSELLAARAKTLRQLSLSDPAYVATVLADVAIGSPDRIFTTDDTDENYTGTMTGW